MDHVNAVQSNCNCASFQAELWVHQFEYFQIWLVFGGLLLPLLLLSVESWQCVFGFSAHWFMRITWESVYLPIVFNPQTIPVLLMYIPLKTMTHFETIGMDGMTSKSHRNSGLCRCKMFMVIVMRNICLLVQWLPLHGVHISQYHDYLKLKKTSNVLRANVVLVNGLSNMWDLV